MNKPRDIQQKLAKPLLDELERIKTGELDPRSIGKAYRQRFVELLYFEAQPVPHIAKILKCSDRTIQRDIDDIRQRNAISPDLSLAKKLVGEFLTNSRTHKAYLMRLARSKDASVAEKANAEYQAAKVEFDYITKLQSLGYLPLKSQEVVGDIFYHNSEPRIPPVINILPVRPVNELEENDKGMDSGSV